MKKNHRYANIDIVAGKKGFFSQAVINLLQNREKNSLETRPRGIRLHWGRCATLPPPLLLYTYTSIPWELT
jgi:hypothetical protein